MNILKITNPLLLKRMTNQQVTNIYYQIYYNSADSIYIVPYAITVAKKKDEAANITSSIFRMMKIESVILYVPRAEISPKPYGRQ